MKSLLQIAVAAGVTLTGGTVAAQNVNDQPLNETTRSEHPTAPRRSSC
jgi:hypothetical protein